MVTWTREASWAGVRFEPSTSLTALATGSERTTCASVSMFTLLPLVRASLAWVVSLVASTSTDALDL